MPEAASCCEPPAGRCCSFRGSFGDVQVEADVELLGFEGTVGVAHHASGPEAAGLFQVSTPGRASLVHLETGKAKAMDQALVRLPSAPFRLTVSAAGSHFKGMVDGKVVAHGHGKPGPPGAVGLFVDGTGSLRILRIQVTPLRHH
jgi:hypothetical protein